MKSLLSAFCLAGGLLLSSQVVRASGTSAPPPVSGTIGIEGSQAFQFESAKARIVSVDKDKGVIVLLEEKKKSPKEIRLTVNAKTKIKAGKEKLDWGQLQVGQLVKVVFDRSFVALSISVQREKNQQA
jgi:ribosomal protein S17